MKSIYELQQIANRLRAVTEADSISPEDTFGLQSDVLNYIAGMEQSADGLGIRKAYVSVAAMNADNTTPIGINGKVLRLGQLVTIYDPDSPLSPDTGNIYAFQNPGWKLVGHTMPESKFLRLLQGIDENNSAYTDPFVWLGELANWQELSNTLNTLYEKKYTGRCRATVAGVNIEVYQFVQNFAERSYSQVILGNCAPSADGLQVVLRTVDNFNVLVRYSVMGKWTAWKIFTPRPQVSSEGDESHYVYSTPDVTDARCVVTMRNTDIFQADGTLKFRRGYWSTSAEGGRYITRTVPVATKGADGAMPSGVFARLGADYPLREYQPTTEKVPIIYPNWAAGGTRTFDLLPATSARAGVMTAADKQKIDNIPGPQSSSAGDTDHYVYSLSDVNDARCVMTMRNTDIFQSGGKLQFRRGHWSTSAEGGRYVTKEIPVATTNANGAMSKDVFTRLGTGATLREGTPTTEKVPVVYPNWADGGTRTFDLLPATSARAGMMTAADKEKLEQIYSNKPLTIKHAYFATGNKTAGITEIDGNYTSEDIALVFGNDNRIFEKIYGQINNGLQILFLSRYNESGGVRVVAPVQVSIEKVIAGTETIYHLDLILPCEGETGYGLKSLNLGYNEANGVYIVY